MTSLTELRGTRRKEILALAEQHGARNLRVCGSVVRGEQTSQDVYRQVKAELRS